MPRDAYGREIDYLRISLTERCNLRCTYGMPVDGGAAPLQSSILDADAIGRVVEAAVAVGFRRFRLTGGEPTLRPDLLGIVHRLAQIPGVADLAMTTNGMRLVELAESLARAGLRRVNIHLDALDPQRLGRVMRYGSLKRIWSGILAAEAAGLRPIKLNAVVVRGMTDADVLPLAALTLQYPWQVRFIETMPLGEGEPADAARAGLVPSAVLRTRIHEALGPLTPVPSAHPSDEARLFRLPGAPGVIGFISPVSEPYCGTCNRMRLTANGRLHLCLLRDDEVDLRPALRKGADHGTLARMLREAVHRKPVGHALAVGVSPKVRQMFQIGG